MLAEKNITDDADGHEPADDGGRNEFGKHNIVIQRPLPMLSQFSKLQQNADLNQPPPNWLSQSAGAGHYFNHSILSQNPQPSHNPSHQSHPSSFSLATHYSDKVGHVDVIADSRNVKKLMTLPYSHSKVSMSIHRIGKTLMIDEFTPSTEDFQLEKLPDVEIPNMFYRKKHPKTSHHRNMYSKLLYYSISDKPLYPMLPASESSHTLSEPLQEQSLEPLPEASQEIAIPTLQVLSNNPQPSQQPSHEEIQPTILEGADDDGFDYYKAFYEENDFPCDPPDECPPQPFHLNVEWNIRDIRMLLGSDLPIFGVGGQPAVSLRLRDMQKPITVLTGLDYWLDNLMFNVPQLAMCYHLNGIVQRYELIKTEDIPTLEDEFLFSPKEVLEVAQNILSFLNAKCTHEGHTYWLFRPKGEDVVKLYDLTPLMVEEKDDDDDDANDNPYARNVAILFYRVSKNMMANRPNSSRDVATIKVLLENCIKLLDTNRNSQIVISAYYMLADLFLNHSHLKDSPVTSDDDSETSNDVDTPINQECSLVSQLQTMSVSTLRQCQSKPLTRPNIQPLIVECPQERARMSLSYIARGLVRLDTGTDLNQWQLKGMYQLLQMSGFAYWSLAETCMDQNKLGEALKYLKLTILGCKVAFNMGKKYEDKTATSCKSMKTVISSAWQLSGDVHVLSTKGSNDVNLKDFESLSSNDHRILNFITSLYKLSSEENDCLTFHVDIETSLKMSINCYKQCESFLMGSYQSKDQIKKKDYNFEEKKKLKERIGNAWNELGVYYRLISSTLDYNTDSKEMEELWSKSHDCLDKGISLFKDTNNLPNQSLLHANLGSLMKLCALSLGTVLEGKNEFSSQEKLYYYDSIDYYIKAKEILRKPQTHKEIWLNIECDLASVYHEIGQQLQERPPISTLSLEEIEREILSVMMKSIHHAESAIQSMSTNSNRFTMISLLIGDCHHRLASLYHKTSFDDSFSNHKLKHSRAQADKHYTKALQSYLMDHHPLQIIRTYLEKGLLLEQLANVSSGKSTHRLLHQSLRTFIDIRNVLINLQDKETDDSLTQLIAILIKRLQSVLKQLYSISLRKGENDQMYKLMYSTVLKDNTTLSLVIKSLISLHNELKTLQ